MGWLRRLIDSLPGVSLEARSPERGAATPSSSDSSATAPSPDPLAGGGGTESPGRHGVPDRHDEVDRETALDAASDLPEEWEFLREVMPGEELNALFGADSVEDMDELGQQWGVRAESGEERWDFESEEEEELRDAASFHDRLVGEEAAWGDDGWGDDDRGDDEGDDDEWDDDEWDEEIEDDAIWSGNGRG